MRASALAAPAGQAAERGDAPAGPARLADLAVSALLEEAWLTPKPALVDRRGSGAHRDLDLDRMVRSAQSLRPTFEALAHTARAWPVSQDLRERLAAVGRDGEAAMLAATGGSNAHRGAVWIVGLLVAGAARYPDPRAEAEPDAIAQVCAIAAAIARHPDRHAPPVDSNGLRAVRTYGVGGARAEACAGFPHARAVGLPALHAARARGTSETQARLDALLAIVASLDDTCLLHRGGRRALDSAQRGARHALALGGSASGPGYAALLALDARLLALNASPGGAADMLAATLFLDTWARCHARQED
jgi:triphosphoribosyl-dephospho-CoA synthase